MWKDRFVCWERTSSQLSDDWLYVRSNAGIVTASSFGTIKTNLHQRYKMYQESQDKLSQLAYTINQSKTFEIDHQSYGIVTEGEARQWYEETFQKKVEQVGLLVPKWDTQIGASPDGLVDQDGMLEIKSPEKMYKSLVEYIKSSKQSYDYSHILSSHYDQMQGGMAVSGRQWCDYIVYCKPENSVFIQRIPFNFKYWMYQLYPSIRYFINQFIDPYKNYLFFSQEFPNKSLKLSYKKNPKYANVNTV
jgi:exodeoxyribonuclease (lambda-induced)